MEQFFFGRRIAQMRKARNMTQEDLGQRLGISNQAVSKWESDQCCPDIMQLPALADVFGITIDALFGREAAIPVPEPAAPVIQELPWEDDNTLHAVCFVGHQLVDHAQILPESGNLAQLNYSGNTDSITSAFSVSCTDCTVSGNVNAGDSVACGNVEGNVQAGDSIACAGYIGGSVTAGDSIRCAEIQGDAKAGDDIHCANILGHANAGGDISCADVAGNVTANGDVTCKNVAGSVQAEGDVTCCNVEGDVTAEGDVECANVSGNVRAEGDVKCAIVSGKVSSEDSSDHGPGFFFRW